jgi:hypothetical protein
MDIYFPNFLLLYSSNSQKGSPDFDKMQKAKSVTFPNWNITCHQNFKNWIPDVGENNYLNTFLFLLQILFLYIKNRYHGFCMLPIILPPVVWESTYVHCVTKSFVSAPNILDSLRGLKNGKKGQRKIEVIYGNIHV